jgi:hypothetical protein
VRPRAAQRAPGRVLLCDTDPGAGDLAIALGTASAHNLADLARLVVAHRRPTRTPWTDLDSGLRLLARAPAPRDPGPTDATTRVLADAAAAHELVVIDAGTLTASHNTAALQTADVLLWAMDATAQLDRCAQLLASDHSSVARDARWLLAASNSGRAGTDATAAQLRDLVPSLDRLLFLPSIGAATIVEAAASMAAEQLLSAVNTAG